MTEFCSFYDLLTKYLFAKYSFTAVPYINMERTSYALFSPRRDDMFIAAWRTPLFSPVGTICLFHETDTHVKYSQKQACSLAQVISFRET